MIKFNFFNLQKYFLFLSILVIAQTSLFGSLKKLKKKQASILKMEEVVQQKKRIKNSNEYYENLFKLIENELSDSNKIETILLLLKDKKCKNFLKKEPYSSIFAGYILYQAVSLKNLSFSAKVETFQLLNRSIKQSIILFKNFEIYLNWNVIKKEYVKLFEFFLSQKIAFHIDGATDDLIILASQEGVVELLELCKKYGLPYPDSGITPFICAASRGHVRTLKKLVQLFGARITEKDNIGKNALAYAIEWGQTETVEWLLSQNAHVDADAFMSACYHGYDDIIDLIIRKARFVDITGFGGNTPLMILAKEGNKKMVKKLLKRGVHDINAANNNQRTALTNAVICGHLPIVRILLRKGADINVLNKHKIEIFKLHSADGELLQELRTHGFNYF